MKPVFPVAIFLLIESLTFCNIDYSGISEQKIGRSGVLQFYIQETSEGLLETRLFLYNHKLFLNWTLDKGGSKVGNLLLEYGDGLKAKGGRQFPHQKLDPQKVKEGCYRKKFLFLDTIKVAVYEAIRRKKEARHLHRIPLLLFTENYLEDEYYVTGPGYPKPSPLFNKVGVKSLETCKESEKVCRFFSKSVLKIAENNHSFYQKKSNIENLKSFLLKTYLRDLKNFYPIKNRVEIEFRVLE